MRCPTCGARNSPRAEWCSQCYAALGESTEPSGPVDEADAPVEPAPGATVGRQTDEGEPDEVAHGFRQGDDGLEWGCAVCGAWNDLDAAVCGTCGEPFARTIAGGDEPDLTPRDPSTVLLASVVLPGAGHIALGRVGDGVVRAVTYLLWIGGALILLRGATPLLPVVPLLVGALGLLAVSVRDAVHLAEGGADQFLSPRVFLWLVVGVVGALVAAFVPGILQVVEGSP